MNDKKINLSEEYYKIVKYNPETNMTWDDFFDRFNVSKSSRLDFGVACILNGFRKIYSANNDNFFGKKRWREWK